MIKMAILELASFKGHPSPDGVVAKWDAESGVQLDQSGLISSITDSISSIKISNLDPSKRPTLIKDDPVGVNAIGFDSAKSQSLFTSGLNISNWASSDHKDTTILVVCSLDLLQNQQTVSTRNLADSTKIIALYTPYSNAKAYFDCGSSGATGRTITDAIPGTGGVNRINAFLFEHSAAGSKIYYNNRLLKTNAASTDNVPGGKSFFSIGSNANAVQSQFMDGDFFEMQVFSKKLDDAEKLKLFRYVEHKYKVNAMPLKNPVFTAVPRDAKTHKDSAGNSFVTQLTDPVSKVSLNPPSDKNQPQYFVDSENRPFIRFDKNSADKLTAPSVNIDSWSIGTGAQSGKQTTVVYIGKYKTPGINFQWIRKDAGKENRANLFTLYAPWTDKKVYVDSGNSAAGRMASNANALTMGDITSLIYERNGANATLFKDGVSIKTVAGLTPSQRSGKTGDLKIGTGSDGVNADNFSSFDLYGIYVFPRVLSSAEKTAIFNWCKHTYGS